MEPVYLNLGGDPRSAGPGDLGFFCGGNLFERAIEEIEPGASGDFVPSHVFILLNADHAVEADATGMVTVVAAARYLAAGDRVRFFRPAADVSAEEKLDALRWLINTYAGRSYGWLNLLSFWIQGMLGLKHAPWDIGSVCSQVAWLYLARMRMLFVGTIQCGDCTPALLFDFVVRGGK